jgi:hypothetical protein
MHEPNQTASSIESAAIIAMPARRTDRDRRIQRHLPAAFGFAVREPSSADVDRQARSRLRRPSEASGSVGAAIRYATRRRLRSIQSNG